MSGKIEKAKGTVKEAIGKAIGNKHLEHEGTRERLVGDAKDKVTKLKHKVEHKIDEKLDELDDDDRGTDRTNG